jgi:hypothetical protein
MHCNSCECVRWMRRRAGMRRDATSRMLRADQLALVVGGAAPANHDNAFGRCGPGTRWPWLGNVYTPQCAAHDAAVRGALAHGESRVAAHVGALPLLPAAVGSYVRARLTGH